MLGSKIYIDFTKYSFNEWSSRLQEKLQAIIAPTLQANEAPTCEANVAPALQANIVISHNLSASNWTQDQVVNYFRSKKVNVTIIENLMPCDGGLLEQLHRTLKEVPEFFHNMIHTDSKANLRDIVIFTTELRRLFNDS